MLQGTIASEPLVVNSSIESFQFDETMCEVGELSALVEVVFLGLRHYVNSDPAKLQERLQLPSETKTHVTSENGS